MIQSTEIVVVMDRSGSMAMIARDAEGGFNALVEEQKKIQGECRLTLAQFDTDYEVVHESLPICQVPRFILQPRGATALLDAVGKTIVDTEKRADRGLHMHRCHACGPYTSKVIFVIVTDGEENSSREFTKAQIKALIERKQGDGWEFVFLGANVDAFAEAGSFGICSGTTLQYNHTGRSINCSYAMVSQNLASVRTGESETMCFTDEQRAAAVDENDTVTATNESS